jgi:hypothetical protein
MASNFKQTVEGPEGSSASSSGGAAGEMPHLDGMNLYDLVDYLNCSGVKARMAVTEETVSLTIEGKRIRFTGGEEAANAAFRYILSHIAEREKRFDDRIDSILLS